MSIRSSNAKKLIDGGAYRIGHLVSNFNLHLVSTDDLKEKVGGRRIGTTAVHLGRLAALGAMKEMYSNLDLKLTTSNSSNIFSTDRIRRNVGTLARFNSRSTYRVLLECQYKNIKFSAPEKFARRGLNFSQKDVTSALKSAETGHLTTLQVKCNIEVFTCSIRTESILAVIDQREPHKCFYCGVAEEKAHMYHLMATCPIVYLVWPQIYRCMLLCTGRHLTITDNLIFSNKVKIREWRSFSKVERMTAATLMAVGRRTLYRAYYARPEGPPAEQEDLVVGILTDELRRSKNIAKSHGKFSSPILKAPMHLGMTLEARLKIFKRNTYGRGTFVDEDVGRHLPGPTDTPLTDVFADRNPERVPRKKRRNHLTLPRLAAALDQASQLPVLTTNL